MTNEEHRQRIEAACHIVLACAMCGTEKKHRATYNELVDEAFDQGWRYQPIRSGYYLQETERMGVLCPECTDNKR